ncbi:MAG: hypothetical protein ACYC91_07935 [Solirubrobacteraceae bacterium]
MRRILLDVGATRLELWVGEADKVETRRAKVSGGIVLSTQALDGDAWLAALSQALAEEAGRSERTRQALERLVTGSEG